MFSLEEVSLESNLTELEEAINEIATSVALVIFEGLDRSQSPRRNGSDPGPQLAEFAHRNDCAVLVTTSITESIARAPNSVVGRLPICRSAAVVFTISNVRFSNDQDEGLPSLTRIKSTIGPKDESFGFEIVTMNAVIGDRVVPSAVLRWTGQRTLQSFAKDTSLRVREKRQSQRERAAAFLRVLLSREPMSSASVIHQCALVQLPEDTARRAATDIGVVRHPQSFGGRRAPDIWSLPGHPATGSTAQQPAGGENPGFGPQGAPPRSHFFAYPLSPLWGLARPVANSNHQPEEPPQRTSWFSTGFRMPTNPHAPGPMHPSTEVAKVAQVGQPWQSAHHQPLPQSSTTEGLSRENRYRAQNETNAQLETGSSEPSDMFAGKTILDMVEHRLKGKGS